MEAIDDDVVEASMKNYEGNYSDRFGFKKREGVNIPTELEIFRQIGARMYYKFIVDDYNREVFEALICWVNGLPFKSRTLKGEPMDGVPSKGAYIAGGTGTGKSMAVSVLLRYCYTRGIEICLNGGRSVMFAAMRYHATEICDSYRNSGIIDYSSRIMCIEDLGTEEQSTSFMGNKINVLAQLLERRGDMRNLITIITSNLPPYALDDKQKSMGLKGLQYGDRAISRLQGMCNYFLLLGNDRRVIKK